MNCIANTDVSIASHSKLHALSAGHLVPDLPHPEPYEGKSVCTIGRHLCSVNACKTVPDMNCIANTDVSIASHSKLHALSAAHLVPDLPHPEPYEGKSVCTIGRHLCSVNACKTVPDMNCIANTDVSIASHSKLHALSAAHLVPDLPHPEPYEGRSVCTIGRHLYVVFTLV